MTALSANDIAEIVADLVSRWHLQSALTPNERRLLSRKLGTWRKYEAHRATWRAESIEVLAWALRLKEKLIDWDKAAGFAYAKAMSPESLRGSDRPLFLSTRSLRSTAELTRANRIAALWTWRARMQNLIDRQDLTLRGRAAVENHAAAILRRAYERDGVSLLGGDLPIRTYPFFLSKGYVPYDEYHIGFFRSPARRYATGWLVGEWSTWDRAKFTVEPGIGLTATHCTGSPSNASMAFTREVHDRSY